MNHGQQSGEAKHEDDAALTEFLASLMDYTPTIPDDLVEHYLAKSGFQCPDVRFEKRRRIQRIQSSAMVVETRRGGKRKDNPTKEESPKVKFAKTTTEGSDNIEKTTTENVDSTTKITETVESTVQTRETSKDSTENDNENEVSEEGNGGGEENDDENEVSEEGNGSGEENDDENEGSEEGNRDGEGKDDENEDSKDEGSEEEKDDDNEGFEEENEEREELANEDRAANENENPPEPEGLNENVGLDIIKPTRMFFKSSEYNKKIKLGTRCMIASTIKTLKNLKPKLSNAEWSWFTEHPQFKHIFHMKSEKNHRVQGMWMLLLRTADIERVRERWFIVNGVSIRYGLREHGLISGLFCHNYPLGYKELGGTRFVDRHFKEGESRRLEDVKNKLVNMGPHKDRLKMAVLFFLASVVCAQTKVGHNANDVLEVFQRAVDDLDYCKSFPWGRFSYDYMLKQISHTMEHFGGVVKEKTLWPLPGFCVPLELLAYEAIPKLGVAFREPVDGVLPDCPRMCKTSFKRNGSTGVSLAVINKELGNTTVIDSIIPTKTAQEERLLNEILEDEDDVDVPDLVVESWDKCLDAGEKIFFKDMFEEDVAGRAEQPKPIEDAAGDGVQIGEQSVQVGDVMKLVKRTMKLLRTVDKKVDQLNGRLEPLEEFVKEAQGKAVEVDEAESQGKGKKQKRKKSLGKGKKQKS